MPICNIKHQTASRRRFMLVVDSDDASRSYTSSLLNQFKYTVTAARTGQEALEISQIVTPVLVVIASRLDDMSGVDLLRKLKQKKAKEQISYIVTCGEPNPLMERACLAAGAIVCLPAPCAIEDLYRVVQMAVEPVPRMNLRIATMLPVSINNQAVKCDDAACTRMLSEQGAYVRTPEPYPLRAKLPLQIHLAGSPVAVEAEVVYSRDAGDGRRHPGMGLQFTHISLQDQMRIRNYIRDEIAKGMVRRKA